MSQAPSQDASGEPIASLLLVDDQDKNLLSLQAILEPLGQNLVLARSGEEALRQLLHHDFALILLDVQMPGLDGFETAKLIKQRERTRHIPIIFLTALSTEEVHVFRGYNVGAIDYLAKPFRPELLRSKVAAFLEIHQRSVRLRQEAEEEKARGEASVAEAEKRSEVRLRGMADAMPQIVFLADRHGKLVYANRRWFECAGRPYSSELDFDDIVQPEDQDRFHEEWAHSVRKGQHWEAEYRLGGRGLEARWNLLRVVPMQGDQDERWVGTSTDIDDRKRLEELIARRSEALEQADLAKDQFLAILSHELRTPLNSVLGWAQVLRRQSPEPAMLTRGLDIIERNARVQAQLINDLLDVSRIVSGKLRIDKAQVDVKRVVLAAVDTVRHEAEQRGVALSLALPDEPLFVHGDQARLQQIVWNLLTNAVKFTPKGGEVYCDVTATADRIHIAVRDTGEGIEPDFLPHVFDRFRQQETGSSRTHGGLGLGLAIVKHLVQMHSGEVHARSEGHGQGSTFSLDFPREEPSSQRPVSQILAPISRASLTGLSILVVEDDEDARAFLCTMLLRLGAEVEGVGNVAEANEALREGSWHLLLSDIGLPDGDGIQLIRQQRTREQQLGTRLPAVAITAFASSQDRQRALQAGFDEHLPKPLDAPTLLKTLRKLRLVRESQPPGTVAPLTEVSAQQPIFPGESSSPPPPSAVPSPED